MTPLRHYPTLPLLFSLCTGVFFQASPSRADGGQPTGVFVLPVDGFSEKSAAILNHLARENLARDPQFAVQDVRAKLEGDVSGDAALKALQKAQAMLQKGKEQYDNLELDAAVDELQKVLSEIDRAIPRMGEGREYVDALLYLGAAYILSGDNERATESFRLVSMYDRRRSLDPKLFPPSIIELYSKVKDEVGTAPVGTLLVRSNPPGAEVYLNGVYKGIAPVQLVKVPEGKHFLRLEKDGFRPWGQKVEFFATHEESVEASLQPVSGAEAFKADTRKLLDKVDDDPPAAEVVNFARTMGLSRLVLASVKQRGDEVSCAVALIQVDPPRRLSYQETSLNLVASNFLAQADALFTSLYRKVKIPTAEVGGRRSDSVGGATQRCNTDSDCTTGEVCDAASGRCIPYAPPAQRFYQKWWFWTIVGGGLAVAGGVAALTWYLLQPARGSIEFTF
ncbi:MAG: PEGA domain-containing protein [Myxococcales bacterium]|nr:PEGA domain-containing protein [Myxococcales bacterium]